jgi:tRNA nucleotidyltransferase (CCA-adding enzyme)
MSAAAEGPARIARLRELPGGAELIELAASDGELALVGGAVRDLLLGREPRELDVVVVGDVLAVAESLAALLGARASVNDRFGTASVQSGAARIDLTIRRAESYAAPGALPEVRPGDRDEDLRRRDFTVNAISMTLSGSGAGELHAQPGALEDLRAGILRVLHENSFVEDPTRLLRLARYAVRLGLRVERHTAELARKALAAHAIDTLSGARIGAELRLALAEPDPPAVFARLERTGVLRAVHPRMRCEEPLVRRALALLPDDGEPDVLVLASLLVALALRAAGDPDAEIAALLDRLEFSRGRRDRVARSAVAVPRLTGQLRDADSDSRLHAIVHEVPVEGVALAAALGETEGGAGGAAVAAAAKRWLAEVRHVRLQITGDDLIAAGIPAGPEIGRRLLLTLHRRLDGELANGRDAELRAAIEVGA